MHGFSGKDGLSIVFPPFSRSGIPYFPGGSVNVFCGDMDAFAVLTICLKAAGRNMLQFWHLDSFKKRARAFKKGVRVSRTTCCQRVPCPFLRSTSAGCFETRQIKMSTLHPPPSYCKTVKSSGAGRGNGGKQISTTRLTGGLLCGYKPLLPASA